MPTTATPTAAEQQALNRIFTSGRRARQTGIAIKDCPFAKGSAAAREWKSGWRSVDKARAAIAAAKAAGIGEA